MTRTDRDHIVPRVPAPRLTPDDWFVHQLSQLAAASTPSDSGLGARTRRVTVIAIASAVLLAGGAYAAERVIGSSVPPGNHEPQPTDGPTDRTSPTPDVTPAEPTGTAPVQPTADPSDAPGARSGTDPSELEGDDVRGSSGPQSDDATDPSGDDTEHAEDAEDAEDTEDSGHLSSERESESDDPEETPSESPSPDLESDVDDLLATEEAAAPAALEDN